jgi:hypothetical protein
MVDAVHVLDFVRLRVQIKDNVKIFLPKGAWNRSTKVLCFFACQSSIERFDHMTYASIADR